MGLGAEVLVEEGVCVREQLEWVCPETGLVCCGNWIEEDPSWGSMYGMADTMAAGNGKDCKKRHKCVYKTENVLARKVSCFKLC